jgi:hypothetical protein
VRRSFTGKAIIDPFPAAVNTSHGIPAMLCRTKRGLLFLINHELHKQTRTGSSRRGRIFNRKKGKEERVGPVTLFVRGVGVVRGKNITLSVRGYIKLGNVTFTTGGAGGWRFPRNLYNFTDKMIK